MRISDWSSDVCSSDLLLLGGTLHDDRMRAEEVDVDRRGGGKAATAGGDPVHHRHRLRDAEPRAAIFLGHGDAEPTAVGHGAVEIFRKLAAIVAVEPIFIVVGDRKSTRLNSSH